MPRHKPPREARRSLHGQACDRSSLQAIGDFGDGGLRADLVLVAPRRATNSDRTDNFIARLYDDPARHKKHARKMLQRPESRSARDSGNNRTRRILAEIGPK